MYRLTLFPARAAFPTKSQAKGLLDTEQGPYVVVAMQECSRMNTLLFEVKRSLLELVKGMDGQLNMTQAMEDLQTALTKNEVREAGRHDWSVAVSSPGLCRVKVVKCCAAELLRLLFCLMVRAICFTTREKELSSTTFVGTREGPV